MDWKDVGNSIVTIAPALGGLLAPVTGGVSAGIGTGIAVLGKAFGLGENPSPEELKTAIAVDKDASLKIMIAENEFKLRQRDQDIDEMKALLADTQSARTRQVESEKATGNRDVNLYILAWTIVVGFFALLAFLLKIPVPPDQNGVIFMLFGALSTGFGQVLQYFFGSSKGSAQKTELLAKAPAIKG